MAKEADGLNVGVDRGKIGMKGFGNSRRRPAFVKIKVKYLFEFPGIKNAVQNFPKFSPFLTPELHFFKP